MSTVFTGTAALSAEQTVPVNVWTALRSPTVKLTPGTKAKTISDAAGVVVWLQNSCSNPQTTEGFSHFYTDGNQHKEEANTVNPVLKKPPFTRVDGFRLNFAQRLSSRGLS